MTEMHTDQHDTISIPDRPAREVWKLLEATEMAPQRAPYGVCCFVRQHPSAPCAYCGETITPEHTEQNRWGHYVAA